jgi:hypothetical protein
MTGRFVSKHDEPLTSNDLDICLKVGKDTEEAQRVAAIIIELYRQGVHKDTQLVELAAGARGISDPD